MPHANPNPSPDIDLQQINARNDPARHIVAGCAAALPTLADLWRPVDDALNLDDSGGGRGWLLIVPCRFSVVLSGPRVPGGWRCCPMCSGWASAPTAPGSLLSWSQGQGWLVRRVRAGRTAGASRPGRRLSRARCG